jgi:hypothetical protein
MFFSEAEGFSCSLCVLYGGLGMSKLQLFIQKISNFFSCKFFSSIFGHQNPGFGTGSGSAIRKNAGSALNQCGSTTLHKLSPHLGGGCRGYPAGGDTRRQPQGHPRPLFPAVTLQAATKAAWQRWWRQFCAADPLCSQLASKVQQHPCARQRPVP